MNLMVRKGTDMLNSPSMITKELQISTWKRLANQWTDDRSTQEMIEDIYENRTQGREIEL